MNPDHYLEQIETLREELSKQSLEQRVKRLESYLERQNIDNQIFKQALDQQMRAIDLIMELIERLDTKIDE